MVSEITIPASLDALERLETFVGQVTFMLPSRLRAQILLAVHELCLNIVEHGYAGDPGEISLKVEHEGGVISFHILDHANRQYYPPPEVKQPDPDGLPEGGWGIFIVHQVMDQVEYRRIPGGNTWFLAKHLTNSAGG